MLVSLLQNQPALALLALKGRHVSVAPLPGPPRGGWWSTRDARLCCGNSLPSRVSEEGKKNLELLAPGWSGNAGLFCVRFGPATDPELDQASARLPSTMAEPLPSPSSGLFLEVSFRRLLASCEAIVDGTSLARPDLLNGAWVRSPVFHHVSRRRGSPLLRVSPVAAAATPSLLTSNACSM